MKTKLLIFGITGDLSTRKLLPALKAIHAAGEFNGLSIIGVSRREVDVDELLTSSLGDTELADKVSIFTMDLANPTDYARLKEYVALGDDEQLIAYLSVPPAAATDIVDFMGQAGLNTPNVKILFEKPFGMDLTSAHDMIAHTARYYGEEQLYRIDHYLAKEMAQNIVAFRGRNALFGNIWNNNFIEAIEVVASEKIGIEGRAHFYEQTGALRDLIQGHLMQLLALTLMDIPHDFAWEELPALRLRALEQLRPVDPAQAYRAQYEGYQDEAGNPGSLTETFVALELQSDQPRWLDVPIRLITGKALAEKTTEVRIHLKKLHEAQSNAIIFRIQPNEGIDIELFTKKPGYDRDFVTRHLELSFPEDEKLPDAYEHVLVDAIRGHKNLFTGSPEVIRSWEILAPVQQSWNMSHAQLPMYPVGTRLEDVTNR
jgi:glucose-6-phosphate 1-dehydrogenase